MQGRSRNFLAAGAVSAGEIEDLLRRLEAFRAAMPLILAGANVSSPVPQQIVILDGPKALRAFSPQARSGRTPDLDGYFLPSPDVNYFVVAPAYGGSPARALFHEYTHWVTYRSARGPIATWISEGLAELYSTTEFSGRTRASLGAASARAIALQQGRWLPIAALISDDGAARYLSSPGTAELFYAESWALVHYLVVGQRGVRAGQLQDFLTARAGGVSSRQAFEAAFRTTPDKLDILLRAYLSQPQLPLRTVQVPAAEREPVEVAPAPAWAALRLQGDLWTRVGRFDDANRALEAAAVANPAAPDVRQSLGVLRSSEGRFNDAIALLAPLTREQPEAFPAQYYLATALAREQKHERAIAHYRIAAEVNGGVPSVWLGLSVSQAALARRREADEAMARVRALDPDPVWLRMRAAAAWTLGDDADVVRDVVSYVDTIGLDSEDGRSAAWLGILAGRRSPLRDDAQRLLDGVSRSVAPGSWSSEIAGFFRREFDGSTLLERATTPTQLGEAHAYVGLMAVIDGDVLQARPHLEWVRDHGLPSAVEYRLVIDEISRLAREGR